MLRCGDDHDHDHYDDHHELHDNHDDDDDDHDHNDYDDGDDDNKEYLCTRECHIMSENVSERGKHYPFSPTQQASQLEIIIILRGLLIFVICAVVAHDSLECYSFTKSFQEITCGT